MTTTYLYLISYLLYLYGHFCGRFRGHPVDNVHSQKSRLGVDSFFAVFFALRSLSRFRPFPSDLQAQVCRLAPDKSAQVSRKDPAQRAQYR